MLKLFFILTLFIYCYCSSDESVIKPDESVIKLDESAIKLDESVIKLEFYEKYDTVCVDRLFQYSGVENPAFPSMRAFGPPKGGGSASGSLDVFVVGENEEAIFELDSYELEDGAGADLKVFENPFNGSSCWYEFGTLEVSADGSTWYGFEPTHNGQAFSCSNVEENKQNLIGLKSVFVHYLDNSIDPRDREAGGDAFDLSQAKKILDRSSGDPTTYRYGSTLSEDGILAVRYFKIVDGGDALPDSGSLNPLFSNGIDIDAICLFNPKKIKE